MAYCDELLFGILFPCYYRNIETMNVISSDTEISRNKQSKYNKQIIYYYKRNIFTTFLDCVSQLINQAKEKKLQKNALKW